MSDLTKDFPKEICHFTGEDYKRLAFVFGLITKLYYYRHDLLGERVELFGKDYKGSPITLRLDYSWLEELGWAR
jgi:hypothetical protein